MKGDPGCYICGGSGRYAVGDESEACVEGRSPANRDMRAMLDEIQEIDRETVRRLVRMLLVERSRADAAEFELALLASHPGTPHGAVHRPTDDEAGSAENRR